LLRKTVSGMIVALLLTNMLTLAFNIQPVKAEGTIYIRADGSVDPPTAPIQRDGDTYTFTDNIYDSIVVQRSNIIIDGAGYMLQGPSDNVAIGFNVSAINNVVIKRVIVKNFYEGFRLVHSSNITLQGNTIVNNGHGVVLESSSSNNISVNNITHNAGMGIDLIYSLNNSITRNTVINSSEGVSLWGSSNNSIAENDITASYHGICLALSSNNRITRNNVTNSMSGIFLACSYPSDLLSSNNMLRGNSMVNNSNSFGVLGYVQSDFIQDIDVSNTVDGKPIYYWINKRGLTVPADAGYVGLINCTHITVQNLKLIKNYQGILLAYTSDSTITRNTIADSNEGISLWHSSDNIISENGITSLIPRSDGIFLGYSSINSIFGNSIANRSRGIHLAYASINNSIFGNNVTNSSMGIRLFSSSDNSVTKNNIANNGEGFSIDDSSENNSVLENNIANNWAGISLSCSSNNIFYHNSFFDNEHQVYDFVPEVNSVNAWDDGYPSGGNYWSDYSGEDLCLGPYQNETGSDGIGDTPYVIDADNLDNYPLMKPYGGLYDIGITSITTSKTVVGQGYSLNITIKILNYGINTETFNVTAYANTTIIDAIANITLASRNSTILTFIWNTTGFAEGNYTITAYAWPVPGETDTADNSLPDGWVFVTIAGSVGGSRKAVW
jgi:parallel beta-helix repeat protein